MRIVYADIVFAMNFLVDYILLYTSSHGMYIKIKQIRLVFASILGGLYAVVAAILPVNTVTKTVSGIVVMAVMCLISLGKQHVNVYIRLFIKAYVFSCLLCGIVTLMAVYKTKYAWLVLILCSAAMVVAAKHIPEKNIFSARMRKVNVIVKYDGRETMLSLLCDSGNVLTDPYTSLPVIVVNRMALGLSDGYSERMRLVPCSTVNGKGILNVITPQDIYILKDKKRAEIRAVIGFNESENNVFQNVDGIIPACLIENV